MRVVMTKWWYYMEAMTISLCRPNLFPSIDLTKMILDLRSKLRMPASPIADAT